MTYRIHQLIAAPGALTIVAQPVTARGAAAKGCEDFTAAGLLAAVLRSAMEAGQEWEIEADAFGRVTEAARGAVRIGGV